MLGFGNSKADAPERDPRVATNLRVLRALEFEARGFSFLPRQPVRSVLTGRHSSPLRGRGLNFEELRHYRPGDDIRSLDWRVTNRTGKPHVRVFTEERERSVQLLVDQRISMFFGSRHKMKSVVAAELAALIAWRVLSLGDRVGALVFNDQKDYPFPARRSRDNVLEILRRLERCNAALRPGMQSRGEQLNSAVDKLARRLSHDALVIYIGDGHGWDEHSERLVKRIALHNDFIAMSVSDTAERTLPPLSEFVVSDGELQVSVNGRNPRLQEQFREQYRADMGAMRQVLKRYRVPVINIDTQTPVQLQLQRALGAMPA